MNSIAKPLMISGAYCSGKGLLCSLFEGHKNIYTLPMWHDMIIDAFLPYTLNINSIKTWRGDERIIYLRRLLSQTDYSVLEQYSLQESIPFPVSSDYIEYYKFYFDFYKFDKQFIDYIFNLPRGEISLDELSINFIKIFLKNVPNLNTLGNINYFITTSSPGFRHYEVLFKKSNYIKVIYIYREAKEWLFSHYSRFVKHTSQEADKSIQTFIDTEQNIKSIKYIEERLDYLQETYKNRFLVINFVDIIKNQNSTIRKICKFLEIDFDPILSTPTFLKVPMRNNDTLAHSIIDSPIRTPQNEKIANHLISRYNAIDNKQKYINGDSYTILFQGKNQNLDSFISQKSNIVYSPLQEKYAVKDNNKTNNVINQIYSTQYGINKCNTTYILKIRADCTLNNLKIFSPLVQTSPSPYTFFKEKIRITNFFVRDPLKVPYLFHISDCVLFGRTDDMKKLWGATLPTPESLFQEGKGHLSLFGNEAGITRFREVPEQTICLRWLERMGYPVHLPHPCATSYEWFKLWENVLAANFEIVDADKSGILFPPHFYNADKRHKTLLTEANFKKMCKAPGTRRRYARLLFHKYIAVWFSPRYWAVTGWLFMNRLTPSLAECIRKLAKKR